MQYRYLPHSASDPADCDDSPSPNRQPESTCSLHERSSGSQPDSQGRLHSPDYRQGTLIGLQESAWLTTVPMDEDSPPLATLAKVKVSALRHQIASWERRL